MPGGAIAAVATVGAGAMASRASSRAADRSAEAIENSSAEATQLQREALQYTSGVSLPQLRAGAEAQARQMLMSGIPAEQVKEFLRSTYAIRPFGAPAATSTAPGSGNFQARPGLPNFRPFANGGRGGGSPFAAVEMDYILDPSLSTNAAAPNAGADDSLAWIDEFDPQSFLESTPGYQFRMDEGQKAIERSAAARGKFFSGQLGKELTRYGQGVASDYWDDLWNEYGVLSGTGQTAGRDINSSVTGFADRAGANAMTAGQARASAYGAAGAANANFWGNTVPGAIWTGYGASQGWFT